MSNKVVLLPVGSSNRRQPLLQTNKSSLKPGTRLGEAVGGTAAVCCCCPCALANIVYLAIYKVPASLCHKALKKSRQHRRRRRLQSSSEEVMLPPKPAKRCTCGCCDDIGVRVHPTCSDDDEYVDVYVGVKSEGLGVEEEDKEALELEKEMWETFYGTGFWRSTSQRNRDSTSSESSESSQRVFLSTSAPNLEVINVSTL